jgi:purine operon repressor
MKAGGTARGIVDLMKEFDATVVGTAVVMVAEEPKKKLIDDYFALVSFDGIDEDEQKVKVTPCNR